MASQICVQQGQEYLQGLSSWRVRIGGMHVTRVGRVGCNSICASTQCEDAVWSGCGTRGELPLPPVRALQRALHHRTFLSCGDGRRLRRLLKRTTPELASCFSAALRAFTPLASIDFGELLQRGGRGGLFMSRSATTACALSTLKAHGKSNLCLTEARLPPLPLFLADAHWRPARHACGTWGMERHMCLSPV